MTEQHSTDSRGGEPQAETPRWTAALGPFGLRRFLLRRMVQKHPLPQALVNGDGRIEFANAPLETLLEVPRGATGKQSLANFLSDQDWRSLLSQCLSDTPSPHISVALLPTTGAGIPVELRFDAHPALGRQHLLLSCWDQRRTQQALNHQAQRVKAFRAVLGSSNDVMLWLGTEGEILGANDRAKLVFGEEIIGVDVASLIDPTDVQRTKDAIAGCRQSEGAIALRQLKLQSARRNHNIFLDARLLEGQDDDGPLLLTGNSVNHLIVETRKLEHASERHERVFQASPDATMLAVLKPPQIVAANHAFDTLFGHDLSREPGQDPWSLELWENPKDREADVTALLAHRNQVKRETTMRKANGAVFHAKLLLELVTIDGVDHLMLVARDVSERVASDIARAESEEKFLRTFQHSPDGIAIIRQRDGRIHDINPALVDASGYPREHFIDQCVTELDVFSVASRKYAENLEPTAQRRFQNLEIEFKTRSGELISALVSANAFELRGEQYLMTIVRDVRELRAAQSRLQRSEERFRGAFENAQLAMLLIDTNGQIFQANRFAQELLSYRLEQLEAMHISALIPQDERSGLKETLGRLQKIEDGQHVSERRMLCQNGLEIWTNFQIVRQGELDAADSYFIIQAADITDIKLSQRRMERMAFYDTLTDLANRRLFQERLQLAIDHCERSGQQSALLYLDLDQFKRVNDTLGHEAGDALLREVALRLTECVRSEDTVGRTGGDEFTVLLFDITRTADAGIVAAKILESLREPIPLSGHNLVVTTSIGIASIPTDGQDANVLMKNADLAMYRAKERGRNNYQFYSEDMNTRAVNRLRTENELREGLSRGEFVLYHQPKYRIKDGEIAGVESLVRWNHPERGLLPPGEFIQIAEETGAIVNLGSWIIEAACAAGQRFAALADDEFTIAVNLSPRQFRDPNLISHVRRCLRTSGLPARLLQIEITETMLMHDVEAASIIINRLHELGIALAIDDFGTGYSSLNYLKKFPIGTVKVDRSFVMDIPHNSDDMAITGAVIAMAHRLNMNVVAEGVETQGQLDFLANNDCEYAQGFLYSKPLPEEEVSRLISKGVSALRQLPKVSANQPVAPPRLSAVPES